MIVIKFMKNDLHFEKKQVKMRFLRSVDKGDKRSVKIKI